MATDNERLAILEVEMNQVKSELSTANEKLDDLLALRNKGAGAFWLATLLAGVGGISIISHVLAFFGFKGLG